MDDDESTSPATAERPTPGSKRKSDDGQPQQRAKRNRYISIACNECKRRKIKCNGETPCHRCGRLSLECLYSPNCCNNFKDSDDFKRMDAHINSLQEQVDNLYSNLNALRSHVDTANVPPQDAYNDSGQLHQTTIPHTPGIPLSPSKTRIQDGPKLPRFHGPTSNGFNLGVARSSLQTMGITGPEDSMDDAMGTDNATPTQSPPPAPRYLNLPKPLHQTKDPIWSLDKLEAIRLCNVWHEEMGLMNPFMDMDDVVGHATMLYTFVEAARRSGLAQVTMPGADSISDDKTNLLKIILAIALTLEGGGRSDLGRKMFDSVAPIVEAEAFGNATPQAVKLLVLTAMYHFHRDDEALAWRVVGLAARICMELGLHRKEIYNTIYCTSAESAQGIRLFWSIYVLDRRWSFGTGMSFALQDADIDPLLPRPDGSTPYLTAMVQYSHIGSKVWKSVASSPSSQAINREEIGFLDYQVIEWLRLIPSELQYTHPSSPSSPPPPAPRGIHRLRVALYLRANQMRILIYRPILHTATSIMDNAEYANRVVVIAKDTINVLAHTNSTTDLYRSQQPMFNYFLISALAVLFLAVSHAPARFSDFCRSEFYTALELVRGLSASSHVSKRLWKTIKVLKEVAPKLGLNVRTQPTQGPQQQQSTDEGDAHSNAAVAMANLSGHSVDELSFFNSHPNASTTSHPSNLNNGQTTPNPNSLVGGPVAPPPPGSSMGMSNSPNGMANDLTSLFEAVGGFAGSLNGGAGGGYGMNVDGFGGDDELARIMRDLF